MSLYSPNDSDDFNFTDEQFNFLLSKYDTTEYADLPTDYKCKQVKNDAISIFTEPLLTSASINDDAYGLQLTPDNSERVTASATEQCLTPPPPPPPPTVGSRGKAMRNPFSQNAILAKANREKKKEFVVGLQARIQQLEHKNAELAATTCRLRFSRRSLRNEVVYLKRVLRNESSLSNVLRRIDSIGDVALSTRFTSERRAALFDHGYAGRTSSANRAPPPAGAGVCIHVDGPRASLEFCAECSRNASQPRRYDNADSSDDDDDDAAAAMISVATRVSGKRKRY